jgi:protein-disulfide isomerase
MVFVIVLGLVFGLAPQGAARRPPAKPAPAAAVRVEAQTSAAASPAAPAATEDCECEAQRPEVLAVVNDFKIPTRDVEAAAEPDVAPIRSALDAARERELQNLISDRLIDLEAKQRGVTRLKLLQDDVYGQVQEPTEDEVRAFYERNRAGVQGGYDQVKAQLHEYIRGQRQQIEITLFIERLRSAAKIEINDPSPKAPATEADRAKVVAVVNGSPVTLGEVEDRLGALRYQARRQIYLVEKMVLDDMVAGALIAQEAARRNMPVQALLDAEVAPKVRKVDAFDASKFYNANKDRFGGRPFAEVKDQLLGYLQEAEVAKTRVTYADGLRKGANVQIFLVEPAPRTFTIDVANRTTKGGDSAPVTLVEFSDFQCPKCAVMYAHLGELAKQYGDKLRIVARHYPLEHHLQSFKAAEAAEAAHEQGKYWEYASLLFASQTSLSPEKYKEFATQLGLDRARFDAALDSGKFAAVVQRDLTDAQRLGAPGTPTFYVNGRQVLDTTPEGLKAAIDAALAQPKP